MNWNPHNVSENKCYNGYSIGFPVKDPGSSVFLPESTLPAKDAYPAPSATNRSFWCAQLGAEAKVPGG